MFTCKKFYYLQQLQFFLWFEETIRCFLKGINVGVAFIPEESSKSFQHFFNSKSQ